LLELSGAKVPADYPLDGTSYLPVLKNAGQATAARKPLYWHFPGYLGAGEGDWRTKPAGAIRSGDWKLQEFFEDGRVELYNLKDDIGESNNLAASRPEKRDELHQQLKAWRAAINAPMPTPNSDIKPPATKKKKKAKAAAE
jgi:hypothetical protein